MEIDKNILLECICHFYKYEFSDLTDYQIRSEYILATVVSDVDISEFYVGTKTVDIDIDEYLIYTRNKKLGLLKEKLHE